MFGWDRSGQRSLGYTCAPCFGLQACVVLLSIPPTICFSFLAAGLKARRAERRAEAAVRRPTQSPRARVEERGRQLAQQRWSFQDERHFWLMTMWQFFGGRSELQDVGPIIWAFLDNHPRTLRVLQDAGHVLDLPLFTAGSPRSWDPTVVGLAMKFTQPLCQSGLTVCMAVGNDVVVTDFDSDWSKSSSRLHGHSGRVTCVASAGCLIATGSEDTMVRLWRDGECLRICACYEWSEWTGTVYLGHLTQVTCVAVSTDGMLVSGDDVGNVVLWRLDRTCIMMGKRLEDAISALTIDESADQDGPPRVLAGCKGGCVRLLNGSSLECLADLGVMNESFGGSVLNAAFMQMGGSGSRSGSSRAFIACKRGFFGCCPNKLEPTTVFPFEATAARFEPANELCVASDGREVVVFAVNGGALRARVAFPMTGLMVDVALLGCPGSPSKSSSLSIVESSATIEHESA